MENLLYQNQSHRAYHTLDETNPFEIDKCKSKNGAIQKRGVHCLQITGQSRLLGSDSSVLLIFISAQTEFVHLFRDNAVTGDIPLISPVLESMVHL